MNILSNSFYLISLLVLLFNAVAIFLHFRTKGNIFIFNKHNNHLANSYVELQYNCQVLEQKQKEHALMMRVLAHDLRGPVSGIISASSLMLMNTDRSEEDIKFLELIKESGNSSWTLVDELLNTDSKKKLEKEQIDLYEILSACTYLMKFQAAKKSQQITLSGGHMELLLNKEKIRRVVINLVTNAIKFSFEHTKINIELTEVENEAIISIQDQGIGVPNGLGNNIFNGSPADSRTGTANEQSFSLGLAVSKQIVEEHNGRIWFENNQPSGSTFFIALPLSA